MSLSHGSWIRAGAEVVWRRLREESEERPAGIGVRFLQMDQGSRNLISRMVGRHLRRSGDPFDLGNE